MRSYAGVISEESDNTAGETNFSVKLVKFARELDVDIEPDDISAVFTLPKKEGSKSKTIVKFCNKTSQEKLFKARFKLKDKPGEHIYFNEDLTPSNGELFKIARDMKKNNQIEGTWTKNCVVMVKSIATLTKKSRTFSIRNYGDFEKKFS